MKYQWKSTKVNFCKTGLDAETAYQELMTISRSHSLNRQNRRGLTADTVLEHARLKKHPLHKCFQWDNTIAAHQYRKEQARSLMRSIEVVMRAIEVVLYDDQTDTQTRALEVVIDVETAEQIYKPVSEIYNCPDEREQLIQQARDDARSYKRRYQMLQKLTPIFKAMKTVFEDVG